jgi:ribonuclease HI
MEDVETPAELDDLINRVSSKLRDISLTVLGRARPKVPSSAPDQNEALPGQAALTEAILQIRKAVASPPSAAIDASPAVRSVLLALPAGSSRSARKQALRARCSVLVASLNKIFSAAAKRNVRNLLNATRVSLADHVDDRPVFITDPATGLLTSSASATNKLLTDHYVQLFGSEDDRIEPANPPSWAEPVFRPQAHIKSEWYELLMVPVSLRDVEQELVHVRWKVAPGDDGISSALFKLLLSSSNSDLSLFIGEFLCTTLNKMMMLGFPVKHNVGLLISILKDATKPSTPDNFRGIMLQRALVKLLSGILARRLSLALSKNPILCDVHDGFVLGGSTHRNIGALLDAIEAARENGKEFHFLSLDIRKCFDKVRFWLVVKALRRLNMPESFVQLISSLLHSSKARVATHSLISEPFQLHTGLPQGNALSPLLCVCTLDVLHSGFLRSPIDPPVAVVSVGVAVGLTKVVSRGYADDTGLLAESVLVTRRYLRWCDAFAAYSGLHMLASKTRYMANDSAGKAIPALPGNMVHLSGEPIAPSPPSELFRHIGAQISLDLDWSRTHARIGSVIGRYLFHCSGVASNIVELATLINLKLAPYLEYHFRYAPVPLVILQHWDVAVARLVSKFIGAFRHIKADIIHVLTGITLPSSIFARTQAVELPLRLISMEPTALARWTSAVAKASSADSIPRSMPLNRCRSTLHSLLGLGVRMVVVAPRPHPWPSLAASSAIFQPTILSIGGSSIPLATKRIKAFTMCPDVLPEVKIFTDASFDENLGLAGCAGCIKTDEWPPAPGRIPARVLSSSKALTICAIKCVSSFAAELHTIAHPLHMLPLSARVSAVSDSLSSVLKISSFPLLPVRRQFRSEERPTLMFITKTVALKKSDMHRGSFDLASVKAHSGALDCLSLGNEAADTKAKEALRRREHHMCSTDFSDFDFQVSVWLNHALGGDRVKNPVWCRCNGDPRKAVIQLNHRSSLVSWSESKSQGSIPRLLALAAGPLSVDELAASASLVRAFSKRYPFDAGWIIKLFADCLGTAQQEASVFASRSSACPRCLPVVVVEDVAHLICCPHLPMPSSDPVCSGLSLLEAREWITTHAVSPGQQLGIFFSPESIDLLVSVKGQGFSTQAFRLEFSFTILKFWVLCLKSRASARPFFSVYRSK